MIFKYDPAALHAALMRDGYVHLKDILSEGFKDYLHGFHQSALDQASNEAADWKVTGKKRQFVFDFPDVAAMREFRAGMAGLTGIGIDDFTISERHLKIYDGAADPWPAPHKDRSASHYSIGLPIALGAGSSVCVFPQFERGANTAERATFLAPEPGTDMAALYGGPDAVMLNEQVGDIVVFLGSELYHERVNAAGTSVLYVKVNGAGVDPLGENLFAAFREAAEA
ncbi:hypothetical protein [Profundibacterium mesophilum]|uniref:Uncharacterized protein n=1 Tax=Profundibacterium mesophilum KAUST100406-0324 TaxID=1037889 RepID=A0A921NS63_9RHOB|nr:hypothetical protein [Profundibacterium mesophilum]KAF0676940.1 hypothetical protein PMES_00737 [Profundibacterium mesophilum KAUST100406-0324]